MFIILNLHVFVIELSNVLFQSVFSVKFFFFFFFHVDLSKLSRREATGSTTVLVFASMTVRARSVVAFKNDARCCDFRLFCCYFIPRGIDRLLLR